MAVTVVPVTKVTLTANKSSFWPNETVMITATVAPANATDKKITFTVSPSDFSITSSGILSVGAKANPENFIGKGNITVTVTGTSTNKKTGKVTVTLKNPFTNYYAESVQGQDFLGWENANHTIFTYGGSAPGNTALSPVFEPHQKLTNIDSYTIRVSANSNHDTIQYDLLNGDIIFASARFYETQDSWQLDVSGYFAFGTPVFGGPAILLPLLTPYRSDAIRAGMDYSRDAGFYVGSVNLPIIEDIDIGKYYSVTLDKIAEAFAFFPWKDGAEYFVPEDIDVAKADILGLLTQGTIPVGWAQPFTVGGITWQVDTDNITVAGNMATIPFYQVVSTVETTITYNDTVISTADENSPVIVTYNGLEIASLESGETVTLKTAGKKCSSDITVGSKTLQCGGKYMEDDITIIVS